MYIRTKLVTNSSSTSIIAFGVYVDGDIDKLEAKIPLPKGLNWAYNPTSWDDGVYVYIEAYPRVKIDKQGLLSFPKADYIQKQYLALKDWLAKVGIDEEIEYIETSWYDG